MPHPLPTIDAFGNLVSMLVGKKCKVIKGPPAPVPTVRGFATYVDASGAVQFVALASLPFLASVGAGLAMIPPAMVAEAIKTGKPSEAILENAFEVLNVAASLYNEVPNTTVHVKLAKLEMAPPVPPPLAPKLAKPGARLDLDVEVPGYPVGKISLLSIG